ncbi:MAG: hypothetical protein ACLQME_01495 [Alphaproteobacteria bacterium]
MPIEIGEPHGKTLPGVFLTERPDVLCIRPRVTKGTEVRADESSALNVLHGPFVIKRISRDEGLPHGRLHE